MPLVLEYPFRLFLYIIVILVLIGIMWRFREKVFGICLFPPCDVEKECEVNTTITTESYFDADILEKYCKLCWEKNRKGECKQDALCYIINVDIPQEPDPVFSLEYCSVSCSKDVTSVFVQYKSLTNETIITC